MKMMRRLTILSAVLALALLSSCKSQFDALLESNDVDLKYKAAFDLFAQKKYSKAASMFESLKLAVNGTLQDDTVNYYTAYSHYKFGDVKTAESGFESFIYTFPRSPFAETAKYQYVDCLYEQTLRYELDPTPTYKALTQVGQYMIEHPNSEYFQRCQEMVDELEERLERKDFEGARLYYITEDYKAAHYALKVVLKENAESRFREDILYYIVMSSYKYAYNSVQDKQKERYMNFTDDYYNFISEYPESDYRKELDGLFNKVQIILKKSDTKNGKEKSRKQHSNQELG